MGILLGNLLGIVGNFPTAGQAVPNASPVPGTKSQGREAGTEPQKVPTGHAVGKFPLGNSQRGVGKNAAAKRGAAWA